MGYALVIHSGRLYMQRNVVLTALTALFAFAFVTVGSANAAEVRLAKQFSMGYMQFNIMEHENLIEKHAKALGLPDVKVSWVTFNGPDAMNSALISNSVDVVAGGVPGLLTIWDKTRGTPQEIKGISALSSQPFLLNTRDAKVKSVADLGAQDRIALPAVKISVQAVTLEMESAKRFGFENFAKLDPLTVTMAPPDATIALESGAAGITSAFSVPPYQYLQLEHPPIHTILNSFDVLGGAHSFTVAWTSARFRNDNPVLYKALVGAINEATQIMNRDKRVGAQFWLDDAKSKLALEQVTKIVSGPQVKWTTTPENTMAFATFMNRVGTLKNQPASWRDYFFPEIHRVRGS
ncbi:MAG: ABC transporter substrate-binding protein [Vulcanimicrobiaceae bacterium]